MNRECGVNSKSGRSIIPAAAQRRGGRRFLRRSRFRRIIKERRRLRLDLPPDKYISGGGARVFAGFGACIRPGEQRDWGGCWFEVEGKLIGVNN